MHLEKVTVQDKNVVFLFPNLFFRGIGKAKQKSIATKLSTLTTKAIISRKHLQKMLPLLDIENYIIGLQIKQECCRFMKMISYAIQNKLQIV